MKLVFAGYFNYSSYQLDILCTLICVCIKDKVNFFENELESIFKEIVHLVVLLKVLKYCRTSSYRTYN